ncbi:MAG: hypothetical protein CO001_03160, partial [Candidatus Portnoybacteria bacterium CG_4_8_14_3_um_filter_40_10]
MKKEEFVTRKYLDKRMDEQTKVVVTAVDGVLDKRLKKFDVRFDTVDFRFNGIEKRMDKLEDNLRKDINNVQILIDGYVKA